MTSVGTFRLSASAAAMIASAAFAVSAVLGGASAYAADPVEFEVNGEISAVVGGVDRDGDDAVDLTGDVNALITAQGSTLLDNGVEIGAVLEARLDADQPRQIFAGGRFSSLLIGGPRGIAPLDSDAYLQGAYAYARGGFGQVIVGRDHGAARALAVTSPTIFRASPTSMTGRRT